MKKQILFSLSLLLSLSSCFIFKPDLNSTQNTSSSIRDHYGFIDLEKFIKTELGQDSVSIQLIDSNNNQLVWKSTEVNNIPVGKVYCLNKNEEEIVYNTEELFYQSSDTFNIDKVTLEKTVKPYFIRDYEKVFFPVISKLILDNFNYPSYCKSNSISGKVYVRLVVKTDKSIRFCSIVNSDDSKYLELEAKRLTDLIPDVDSPAKLNGKPIDFYFVMPIAFKIM